MAEATNMAKESLVQEISQGGNQVPDEYIHKEGFPEAIDAPASLWTDTLLIDFSLLSSSSPDNNELAKLRSALSDWGCFQVINHGIESSLLDELIEVTKQFFDLPLEEKLKCSSKGGFQGYGSDLTSPGKLTGQWNDRLFLTVYPEKMRQLQLWPEKPNKFREIVHEYSTNASRVVVSLLKAMAMSLNIEDTNCFTNQLGKKSHGSLLGIFIYYPRCPRPEQVLGVRPHTDSSMVTILVAQKDVEGLEIKKDDQWFKVPIVPGSLLINLGDLGKVMTNGIFKSVEHRVATNSEKNRTSVVLFCNPENGVEIGAPSELVTQDHPQLYRKFNTSEFAKAALKGYQLGHKPLDAFSL